MIYIRSVSTASQTAPAARKGYSFYAKLWFLYFLNLIDWLCTAVLLQSGWFIEANPLMRSALNDPLLTVLLKGGVPLLLTALCTLVYRLSGEAEFRFATLLVHFGIIAYSAVIAWHIVNFILLFSAI